MPLLSSAVVQFVTPGQSILGNDDKDHDTQIGLQLRNSSQTPDCSVRYTSDVRFPDDGSAHLIQLFSAGQIVNRNEYTNVAYLTMQIFPVGHDTWIFAPSIILDFDNGEELKFYPVDTYWKLDQNSGQVTRPFYTVGSPELVPHGLRHLPPQGPLPPGGHPGDPFLGPHSNIP